MKKLIGLIVLMIMLVGCESEVIEDVNVIGEETNDNEKAEEDVVIVEAISHTSTPVNKVVFMEYGHSLLPLSHLVDEKMVLSGDHSIMVENPLSEAFIDDVKTISIDEMFREDSDAFESLGFSDNKEWNDSPMCEFVGQVGDWDLFPNKVGFAKYRLDNQPVNEPWYSTFKENLKVEDKKTPLLIKYVYTLDLDKDGIDDYIINASNLQNHYNPEDQPVNLPHYETAVNYNLTRIIWGTDSEPYAICNSSIKPLSELDVDSFDERPETEYFVDFEWLYDPFSIKSPINDEAQYYQYSVSYQYDEFGAIMECPMFTDYDGWNTHDEIIFIDIDGDGISELITFYPEIYSKVNVYKINENHEFYLVYSFGTPA